jgi:xanthine/CO dehydrogenase XdhC/CoxF family maturation factor
MAHVTTRLFVEGDKVIYSNPDHTLQVWRERSGKKATITADQVGQSSLVRMLFDGETRHVLVDPSALTLLPVSVTIHDQAREQFELAMTYAEDGAFATAATILQKIANSYDKRFNETRAELIKGGKTPAHDIVTFKGED